MRKISILTILIFVLVFVVNVFADGEFDNSFAVSTMGAKDGNVNVFKTQPDGKVLIGGYFTEVSGFAKQGIVRLNIDGSLDTTFDPPDFYAVYVPGGVIYSIELQSDGKILVGGVFNFVNGVYGPGIRRLNQNGTIDNTFNVVELNQLDEVRDLEVLSNDQFYAGGKFQFVNNTSRANLVLFNADGTPNDTNFVYHSDVDRVKNLPDGKILVVTGPFSIPPAENIYYVRRMNSSGTIDAAFPQVVFNNKVFDSKLLPDGSLLVVGNFNTVNGFPANGIAKINSNDGSIDFNFTSTIQTGNASSIELQPDGKILLKGGFTFSNSMSRSGVVRLNSDGTLDTSFNFTTTFPTPFVINTIGLLPSGQALVGMKEPSNGPSLLRINADGSLDSSYSILLNTYGDIRKIFQQPDGKILFCGRITQVNNVTRIAVGRVNLNGTLDNNFLPPTYAIPDSYLPDCSIQNDGKILVKAQGNNSIFDRLNPDGSIDASSQTVVSYGDIVPLPDGKFLTVSYNGDFKVARYNSNGTLDSTFTTLIVNSGINRMIRQPDGKILIAGGFSTINSVFRGGIARLNANGTLDTTFNPPGGAGGTVYDLDLQPDGKILLGGFFTGLNGSNTRKNIGRLNPNGSLDTTFAQTTDGIVYAVKALSDGKIMIGGTMSLVGSNPVNRLARLTPNGSQDFSFSASANSTVYEIIQQTDGKILIGGEFTKVNGNSALYIARLLNSNAPATTPFDFDGDGKSDITVFRPSNRFWYGLNSSNSAFYQFNFGAVGDVLTPADYNFDGKCDIAIFRNGDWWYQAPSGQHTLAAVWGQSGDKPIPSDWDGDGKTDFIVYRPSNGVWYRLSSGTGQMSFAQFGIAEDLPLQADFDGDGKSDLAVYRPSTGTWYWLNSSNGQFAGVPFGTTGDIPQAGDFDGDGKTDFAVYRPSNGYWYFLYSGTNYSFGAIPFGLAEDRPTVADYDGDGKTDIAVFRPSSGTWYLLQSQTGFAGIAFGTNGDIPIPSAYYP